MKYKRVIWDWNGTILDDLSICLQSINKMLGERGMPLFDSRESYFKKFRFPIKEYYRDVGFDFEKEPFPQLAAEYMSLYDERLPNCPLFADAKDVLTAFKNAGLKQMILSAAEKRALDDLLKAHGIDGNFDRVLGLTDIYAKGKEDIAKEWLLEYSEDMSEAVMIGDTIHDSEIADILGCDCILVCGGHNSYAQLLSAGKPIVGDLREAERIILGE